MIDENMKIFSLGMIIPLVPRIVQKKLLFELLNLAKIKLNEEELKTFEKDFETKEDIILSKYYVLSRLKKVQVQLKLNKRNDAYNGVEEMILEIQNMIEVEKRK